MRSSFAKTVVVVAFGLALAACGPIAYLVTEQDPAQVPQKQDPVFVTVPENSSIRERQLLPVLKRRMLAEHFNVVNDVQSARWVLGVSPEERAFSARGTLGTEVGAYGATAVAKTSDDTTVYEHPAKIYLTLLTAQDYLLGKRQPVWTGYATADRETLNEYTTTIIDDLLGAYGTNYEDERMMRFQDHPE